MITTRLQILSDGEITIQYKKIILTICKGHQNIAGAQLYLQHLAKVFPPEQYELHYGFQARDGVRVFDEIEMTRPVKKWEYDWRHMSFIASFTAARKLYKQVNPDIVIFNSNEDEVIPSILAAHFSGCRLKVMVVHWAIDECSMPLVGRKTFLKLPCISCYALLTRLYRWFSCLFLDGVIFVNKVTRQAFKHLYWIPPGKCESIYNGIDIETFRENPSVRSKMRDDLGVNEEEHMILATGNLSPVKGHDLLITAVQGLVRRGKKIKCFIAGQGELEKTLNRQIITSNLAAHVKLIGYRDDVADLLAAADIFCMPSLNEALGYSLLEAMAAKKPIVASRVGGIPEVITDGEDGLLVQKADVEALETTLDTLCSDIELGRRLGQSAYQKVNKLFSQQLMIKKTKQFFKVS